MNIEKTKRHIGNFIGMDAPPLTDEELRAACTLPDDCAEMVRRELEEAARGLDAFLRDLASGLGGGQVDGGAARA